MFAVRACEATAGLVAFALGSPKPRKRCGGAQLGWLRADLSRQLDGIAEIGFSCLFLSKPEAQLTAQGRARVTAFRQLLNDYRPTVSIAGRTYLRPEGGPGAATR